MFTDSHSQQQSNWHPKTLFCHPHSRQHKNRACKAGCPLCFVPACDGFHQIHCRIKQWMQSLLLSSSSSSLDFVNMHQCPGIGGDTSSLSGHENQVECCWCVSVHWWQHCQCGSSSDVIYKLSSGTTSSFISWCTVPLMCSNEPHNWFHCAKWSAYSTLFSWSECLCLFLCFHLHHLVDGNNVCNCFLCEHGNNCTVVFVSRDAALVSPVMHASQMRSLHIFV